MGLIFKAKLLFLRRRNRLLFTSETRNEADACEQETRDFDSSETRTQRRQAGCLSFKWQFKDNLQESEGVGEGVYSKSLCIASSQNGNVSCWGFIPGGRGCGRGEVFRFICLFEKVRNAPSTILKTLNLSVTWKTEADGRRTRSTDDSSDGVPPLGAEIFHIVSHYARLTLSYFSNVTCLQDVSELPGN